MGRTYGVAMALLDRLVEGAIIPKVKVRSSRRRMAIA
jgi:hypothetical protein